MSDNTETYDEQTARVTKKLDELADELIARLERAKSYEDPFEKTMGLAGVLTVASLHKDFYIEMGDLASLELTPEQIGAIGLYTMTGESNE